MAHAITSFSVPEKYEIKAHNIYGRHLVATRAIKMGEVIFKENPIVVGPKYRSEVICLNCHTMIRQHFICCKRCNMAPVCFNCHQNQEIPGYHEEPECRALQSFKEQISPTRLMENLHIVTVLRGLLLRMDDDLDKWKKLVDLESHLEERRKRKIWEAHEKTTKILYNVRAITEDELRDELVQKICGIIDVNSFELRGAHENDLSKVDTICGVYPLASMMAHNCMTNTYLAVDNSNVMTVRASVDIDIGTPIYYNYTEVLQGTINRREHMRIGKYFECDCRRCSDSTEFGLHLNSLKCNVCFKDHVIMSNPLNVTQLTEDDLWFCMDCGCTYTGEEIKSVFIEINQYSATTDRTDVASIERLLAFALERLNPNHHLVLDIKHTLGGLLRSILSSADSHSIKILQRKLDICNDFIKVLDVLEPGVSRLKAMTLYESHVPMMFIPNQLHQKGNISTKEYLEKLLLAEINLKEAIRLLLFEPPASPEGELCRRAMAEMKKLQLAIVEVRMLVQEDELRLKQDQNNKTRRALQRKKNENQL